MATKVQVEVAHQQAKAALKEIVKGIEEVVAASKKAQGAGPAGAAASTDDGMASIRELLSQSQLLGGRIDALGNAASSMGAASTAGFGKAALAIGGVVAAIGAAQAAWKGFQSVVKTAADNGNLDAQRLVTAFGSIGTAVDDLQQRLATTQGFRNYAQLFTDISKEISTTILTIGHFTAGVDEAVDKQLELNAARKQMGDVSKMLDDFDRRARVDRLQEQAREIKSIEEITARINEEREAIVKKTQTGLADARAIQVAAEKLNTLESRRKQIVKENEQAAKDAIREEVRAAEEAEEDKARAAKENDDFKRQMMDDMKAAAERERREAEAAEKAHLRALLQMFAEYQRQLKAIEDAARNDPGVQGLAKDIQDKARTPEALIKRLADDAAATTEAQIRSAGGMSPEDELSREQQRMVDQARREANRRAVLQARGGYQSYSPEQIQQAGNRNAEMMANSLQQNTKVSTMTADVVGTMTQEFAKNSADVAKLQADVQLMMQQVQAVAGQNQRRRSQSNGARP